MIIGGWIKDPPAKDWGFKDNMLPRLSPSSGDVDLAPWCTEVSDQLSLSSCAANAVADSFELCTGIEIAQAEAEAAGVQDAVEAGMTLESIGKWPEQISRLQLYYNGRSRMTDDGVNNLAGEDRGMYIRAAFDAARILGVCPEKMWEYRPENVNKRPTVQATFYALKHKLKAYYRIPDGEDDTLDQVREAVRGRHPVVFAVPVTGRFKDWAGGGEIPAPDGEEVLGYHAIMAVGTVGEAVKVRNSWGTGWGDGGYALLHPGWFSDGNARSLFVPTKGVFLK